MNYKETRNLGCVPSSAVLYLYVECVLSESQQGIRIWVLCIYVNWEEIEKEDEVDHTDVVTQGRLYLELADIFQGSGLLNKLVTPSRL